MENFKKKLKEKKKEELNLEKTFLKNLNIDFKNNINNIEKKTTLLNEETEKLKLNMKEIIEIESTYSNQEINKHINEKKNIINENEIQINNHSKLLKQILEDKNNKLNLIEKEKDLFNTIKKDRILSNKKNKNYIETLEDKINKLNKVNNNYNLDLKKILNEIKINQKQVENNYTENVLERHNLIQESYNNLLI